MQLKLNDDILIKEKDDTTILTMKGVPKDFVFDFRALKKHLKKLTDNPNYDLKCDLLTGLKPIENDFVLIEKKTIKVSFKEKEINNTYLALVFAGYLTSQILRNNNKQLKAYSHIKQLDSIEDLSYYEVRKKMIKSLKINEKKEYSDIQYQLTNTKLLENLHQVIINKLNTKEILPTFDNSVSKEMIDILKNSTNQAHHISIETIIIGVPKNIDTLKRSIADYLFMIESLNGIYFGQKQIDKKESMFINKAGGINHNLTTGDDLVVTTNVNLVSEEFKNIGNIIPLIESLIYLAIFHTKKKC